MRLGWLTDVHLNFLDEAGLDAFCASIERAACDAVLLTGDISEAPEVEEHLLRVSRPFFFPVFFVLGNHDFYRGLVNGVRDVARRLTRESRNVRWLPEAGIVNLGSRTALVGHDGWADGRAGDWERSEIFLNDYLQIADLVTTDKGDRQARMLALATESAMFLEEHITRAFEAHDHVIVATHVPPWRDACWYQDRISDDDWLPHFSSLTVGDAIERCAVAHPDKRISTYCGHTHYQGVAQIRDNLVVHTGPADYGHVLEPKIIEV